MPEKPMPLPLATKTKGFVLLGFSALASGTGLVLPFIKAPLLHKPLLVTVALVAGELFFAASLVFLGKQYGRQLRQKIVGWFRNIFRRKPPPDHFD